MSRISRPAPAGYALVVALTLAACATSSIPRTTRPFAEPLRVLRDTLRPNEQQRKHCDEQ